MTSNKGFSMVEMLVVVAVFGILAVGSVNLFFSSLVGSGKESSIRLVKESGDFAIKKIETGLREAREMQTNQDGQICEQGMNALRFVDLDDVIYEVYVDDSDRLVMEVVSGGSSEIDFLTSSNVIVDRSDGGLVVNCEENVANGIVYVGIVLQVEKGASSDKWEDRYQETFKTSVTLRNRQF